MSPICLILSRLLILASVLVFTNTKTHVLILCLKKRKMYPYIGLKFWLVLFLSSLFTQHQQILFLSILQSIKDDTPAVSVPADQKPAQTLFTPTMASPISIPAVTQATTNIQVICIQLLSLSAIIITGLEMWQYSGNTLAWPLYTTARTRVWKCVPK